MPFCLVLVVGIVIGVNVGKKDVAPKGDVAVTRIDRAPQPVEVPFVPIYMGTWE